MAKVSGKTLKFWFGALEIPVDQVGFDSDFQELEATDSTTPNPFSEFIMNRTKRTLSIDCLLRAADGAEINSGTLVAGVKYRVTAKDTVLSTYEIGEIFTAIGTETMSATDKVKPLGAPLNGKDIECSINAVGVPVTSLGFNQEWGEFDSTDSDTAGDSSEFIAGRHKSTSSLEVIMRAETVDLLDTNPVSQPIVLTFGSGFTLTGKATFRKKSIIAISKGDLVKVSYEVTWNGAIVSTLNQLTLGVSTAIKIIYQEGTTNKEQLGNALIFGMTLTADVNSLITANYTGTFAGAVTENELT